MSGIGALCVPSQSSVRTLNRMKGVWLATLALLTGSCTEREASTKAPTRLAEALTEAAEMRPLLESAVGLALEVENGTGVPLKVTRCGRSVPAITFSGIGSASFR